MLARWQALGVLLWLGVLLGGPLLCWHAGRPWAALAVLALCLSGHAWWLAAGLLLAHAHNRHDPAPRARPAQLLRAWWGEACAAPRVFAWRQPFRAGRWPDHLAPQARGRPGLLLVHGFVCNRGLWNDWLPWLRGLDIAHVALSLEPVLGSIDDTVGQIEQAVRQLEAATGVPPLVLAHSMGGLAVRAWWRQPGAAQRLRGLITLGTPHQGTALARWAISENGRQMQPHGPWLRALAAGESPAQRAQVLCIYSHADNIVFPASNACLPGARCLHLPATAHVALVQHPAVRAEVLSALGRAAQPA